MEELSIKIILSSSELDLNIEEIEELLTLKFIRAQQEMMEEITKSRTIPIKENRPS